MPKASPLTYRPDIDGLRAIAVIVVVGFHVWPREFRGGFVGVDIFFVISGYLISGIVLKGLAEARFSFGDFYIRRIKRIFPALMLVLATSALIGWFILWAASYAQLGTHIAAAVGFVLNFVLWHEAGYFDTEAVYKPLLHLWSLSIEEQFYLVWPMLLLLTARRGYNIAVVTALIAIVSFLINVALVDGRPALTFFMPFTRAWELMFGSLLASLERSPPSWLVSAIAITRARSLSVGLFREIAGWGGAAMITVALLLVSPAKAFPGWWALLPTLGTVLVIMAGPDAKLNRYALAWRPMVAIGLISYPLYLWHWPLFSFAWQAAGSAPPRWERLVLVAASFILAWLTYKLLEHPIRRNRSAQPALALLVVALVIGGSGYSIVRDHGVPSRTANATGFVHTDYNPGFVKAFLDKAATCAPLADKTVIASRCQSLTASPPEIAVFGDSHAEALYPGLIQAMPGHSIMFLHACAFPLVGLIESNRPFNGYCSAQESERTVAELAGIDSLKTVVLSFRGPLYLLGKGFGTGTQESEHDVVLEPVAPEQRGLSQAQLFAFGVSAAVDVFKRAHKNVVVVLDAPELGFDIQDCLFDRPLRAKRLDCQIERSAVEARQKEYRAVIGELWRRFPEMKVFETMPLFCDELYCYGIRDHHVLYMDDDHIVPYGSQIIGEHLAAFLEQNGLVD
jgi:peptidoglycan/LPS O-acetylase OafA/YrhL